MVLLRSTSSGESLPVRGARWVLLPLTLALALAAAWTRSGAVSLAALRVVFLLSILAGLIAFWHRPSVSRRGWLEAAPGSLLWGILLVWILAGAGSGIAPGRAFPYLLAFAAAALLLYAGRQSARFRPRLTLLALACGVISGLAAGSLRSRGLVVSSGFVLALGVAVMAPVVALLCLGEGARGRRWWLSAVCLTALFCASWGVRAAIPRRVPASPPTVRQLAQSAPLPQAVRQTVQTRLFGGIGLGALDPYLAVSGNTSAAPESNSPTPSLLPERQANWRRGAEMPPPGPSPAASREFARVRRPYEPKGIGSLRVFALELGVLGAGLALVCVLFLVMDVVEAVWTSPRSALSLLALGTLAIWVGILAEGAMGPGLRQPGAIALWGALAGVLWGMAAAIRDREDPARLSVGGFEPEEGDTPPGRGGRTRGLLPVRRISFSLSVLAAVGLALAFALPRRAERLDTEDSCYAALVEDPFREDAYAALARLHFEQKEVARMEMALESGRAYCPDSALLAAWEVEYARLADDPALLEAALVRAARLSPEEFPGLRSRYLEDLARIQEHQNRLPAALETYCRLFQYRPHDPDCRRAVQRLAAAVYPEVPRPVESGKEE